MKPQDVAGAKIINSDKLIATPSELLCTYAGPSSILLLDGSSLVALVVLGGAYSYDGATGKYRWTLQRPLCENRPRFIEKLQGIQRVQGGTLGLGFAFNGVKGAPDHAHRRGVWLPNCSDLKEAISFGAEGAIIDVAAGTCDTPEEWKAPPRFPGRTEF